MSASVRETEYASRPTTAQDAAIDQVEAAIRRLRISPRKVLGSLSHLRIDRARIKPIEGQVPKAGGQADVETAMLASTRFSTLSEPDDAEYVAIKKLRMGEDTDDDRALAPLAHEINLLNTLSHENVVKIFGFVEEVEQGIAWMVFAWEENGNLREFIRSARWELPERLSLIADVARGLSYLHGRNPPICHGDLKSLNILVNAESRAIITDFGSARAVGLVGDEAVEGVRAAEAASRPSPAATGAQKAEALSAEIAPSGDFITMTGPAWTVRWAAPELLDGYLPGLASDIWALGWICWEAVTGNFPFDKVNDTAVVLRIAKGDLPAIENDDQLKQIKALCSLMRDCWKLDMSERPTALRCQKVVQWMDQVVPSRREGSGSSLARSSGLLHALGWVQLRNGRYTEARECFEQALKVAESVGDEDRQAQAFGAIGDTLYLQGEYSKAEESLIQARDIFLRIGKQFGFAQSVKRLGDVYTVRADYSEAEESYIQAREIFSRIRSEVGLAQSVKSLAGVYYMRDEYFKAEEMYIQPREIYSQIGNQRGFAQSVEGLGNVYRMLHQYSKAEEAHIQAREVNSQIGDQLGLAQSSEGMGRLHSARGEYAKAEESYSEAQRIYRRIGDMYSSANVSWYLAWLHRDQAQYDAAERLAREASAIYDGLGLTKYVKQCDEFLEEIRQST